MKIKNRETHWWPFLNFSWSCRKVMIFLNFKFQHFQTSRNYSWWWISVNRKIKKWEKSSRKYLEKCGNGFSIDWYFICGLKCVFSSENSLFSTFWLFFPESIFSLKMQFLRFSDENTHFSPQMEYQSIENPFPHFSRYFRLLFFHFLIFWFTEIHHHE